PKAIIRAAHRGKVGLVAGRGEVLKRERVESFEQLMLPHAKSAFNLARWLTGNEHDAEDVLQEAFLRAFTFFDGFKGANPRTWLLAVVRNCCFTWLEKNRPSEVGTVLDDEQRSADRAAMGHQPETPEDSAVRKSTARQIDQALEALAAEFREVFILR